MLRLGDLVPTADGRPEGGGQPLPGQRGPGLALAVEILVGLDPAGEQVPLGDWQSVFPRDRVGDVEVVVHDAGARNIQHEAATSKPTRGITRTRAYGNRAR